MWKEAAQDLFAFGNARKRHSRGTAQAEACGYIKTGTLGGREEEGLSAAFG
jgi:hypothetical protein